MGIVDRLRTTLSPGPALRRCLPVALLLTALSVCNAWAQAPYSRFDDVPDADSADDVAHRAAWQSWTRRSAATLAATGQPRELALAAMLHDLGAAPPDGPDGAMPSRPAAVDPQSTAWRRDAAARAGGDVLANMLLSHGADDATRLRATQRWLGADPQNLAALLTRGGNIEVLLADARSTTRFDLDMLGQVRWMQAALLRTPPTAEERAALADTGDFVAEEHAALQASGLWSAFAIPTIQPLLQACAADAVRADPVRVRDCGHIARTMADASDTRLGEMMGLGLLERLATSTAERAQLQARRRVLDWQMLAWGQATAGQPRDGASQFVRLLADPRVTSEHDLVLRALEEAGTAPRPPVDWQPPY